MTDTYSLASPDAPTILATACLWVMLAIATVTDVVSHRIPNALLLPSLVIAALLSVAADGPGGLLAVGAGLCAGLAMLMPLYMLGGTAAGDVKLLAVAGAYLGPVGAVLAGMFTFMAGAVFGLAWIAWRTLRQVRAHSAPVHSMSGDDRAEHATSGAGTAGSVGGAANEFAYAPAISAGCVAAAWYQGWTFFGA